LEGNQVTVALEAVHDSRTRAAVATMVIVAAFATVVAAAQHEPVQLPQRAPDRTPPADSTGLDDGWYVLIDTSYGDIIARLLPEQAPQTVAHFAALAEGRLEWIDPMTGQPRNDPYYDGVRIHKVLAGQRFETGDHTATGRGAAPVYVPPEGFGPYEFSRGGRLGMTRGPQGRISGSLFFVTADSQPWLNNRHPCFGVVVSGIDIVRIISSVQADSSGVPLEPVRLEKVRIFRVGQPPDLPDPVAYVPTPRTLRLRDDLQDQR